MYTFVYECMHVCISVCVYVCIVYKCVYAYVMHEVRDSLAIKTCSSGQEPGLPLIQPWVPISHNQGD